MTTNSIPIVNNQFNNFQNQQGMLVSKITLSGREYDVFAVLEDSKGNTLPLPDRFDENTMRRVDEYVQSLITAHKGNGLERRLDTAPIDAITKSGIALHDGSILSHEFTIDSIKTNLSEEDKNKFNTFAGSLNIPLPELKAQDIWNRLENEIKTAPKLQAVQSNPIIPSQPPSLPALPAKESIPTEKEPEEIESTAPVPAERNSLSNPAPVQQNIPTIPTNTPGFDLPKKIKLYQNLASWHKNRHTLSEQDWEIYQELKKKYESKKGMRSQSYEIEKTFEEYLENKVSSQKVRLYEMKEEIKDHARPMIDNYYKHKIIPSEKEMKDFITYAQESPVFNKDLLAQYIHEDVSAEEGVRFIKALERYMSTHLNLEYLLKN
ncbi:MAG TPA: hypothetical protein VLG49_06175 [Rhabdochlamydiaceae bacterium]|nr:hypothetical protein [Rhabdochlamydiaceae bacterium]